MKLISCLFFCLIFGSFTGCSAERMARINAETERQRQEFLDNKFRDLQNTCDRYGFKRGTVDFANCMQKAEAQWNSNYNQAIQQQNQAFGNMIEAFKPPTFIQPVCNGGMMPATGKVDCR